MDRIHAAAGQPEFANSKQRVFSADYLERRLTETDFKTRYPTTSWSCRRTRDA